MEWTLQDGLLIRFIYIYLNERRIDMWSKRNQLTTHQTASLDSPFSLDDWPILLGQYLEY
jgi:hypothetical protein